MSSLSVAAMKEPLIDVCKGDMINSTYCKILDLDLCTMKKEDVEFTSEYSLTINRDDTVHALIAWFDTPFENLENPNNLSTSPYKKATHWK
jgi:protein arginine N-methyltransferase 1